MRALTALFAACLCFCGAAAAEEPAGKTGLTGLGSVAGDGRAPGAGDLDRLYDNNRRGGTAAAVTPAGAGGGHGAAKTPAAGPRTPAAPAPVPVLIDTPPGATERGGEKSEAWTSDAYGITLYVAGRTEPRAFRSTAEAESAIRKLPAGSINKIIIYGHGSPGMQTVGNTIYDAENTPLLLRGKMAPDGVVQFAGCNTASIGDATLNPAVGLSMIVRRVMYFSVPYFTDRFGGVSARDAHRDWDGRWNADLARDTSAGLPGAVVCGYRTFGLVPGRFPGVTRVMGNQDAATPGYIAGKKACYKDGKEVEPR